MEYIALFRELWFYADRERWKVVVYLVFHAISILGELGKPYAFAMVVNALQNNRPTVVDEVIRWLLFYVVCFCVFELFHRSARFIERYVAFRIRKRFVTSMYDQLQSLPLAWHSDNHSGAVIDRVNKAANGLYSFGQTQAIFVGVIMKFWGPLIILWQIDWGISVVAVVTGFILVYVTRALYKLSVPEYRAQNDGLHKVAAALHDYVSNIRTIIMLRLGQFAKKDIDDRTAVIFPHIVKENKLTQLKCFINSSLMMLLDVGMILYYINAQKQAGAVIMIGSVTAIFQYLSQCMSSFQFYAGDYESVIHWQTDFDAVRPILQERTHLYEEAKLDEWHTIAVQSLGFSYGDGRSHLEDISLKLMRGQKVALVGESGAGKSTLLNILRGLTPVRVGTLKIDDGRTLPFASLSNTTTLIPQEPEIFENNIRYNITMGMPASEEAVRTAIWAAAFTEVADRLPTGLDSDVREKGVNLSGGEKQRLALARGVFAIRDSSIVLLDEPTSNVDPATEMVIFKRLFELMSGRCIVSVLHRLHLVRLFDYVYVLKEGEIVEEGTFDDLRDARGEFSRLWNKYVAEEDTASATEQQRQYS